VSRLTVSLSISGLCQGRRICGRAPEANVFQVPLVISWRTAPTARSAAAHSPAPAIRDVIAVVIAKLENTSLA
jgi:hypothetical protein